MKSTKKEIKSVKASDMCQELFPCIHDVTIEYTDGTKKTKGANGFKISERYSKYLDEKDKKHFSCYAAGMFNNNLVAEISTEEQSREEIRFECK